MRSLLARVALCAVVAALLPLSPVAAQSTCPAAGGVTPPTTTPPDGEFRFSGRGWGHGVGMSQYGAQGAAKLGCSAEQILTTYFPQTRVAAAAMPDVVRVGLWPAVPNGARPVRVDAVAVDDGIRWVLRRADATVVEVATQAKDARWRVSVDADGRLRLNRVAGDGALTEIWRGGGVGERLEAQHNGKRIRLRAPDASFDKNRVYRYGTMRFISHRPGTDPARLTVVSAVPGVDNYLYGLAEVPWGWPAHALRAQAIAGRSYLVARQPRGAQCDCDVYDSTSDQVFAGDLSDRSGFAAWKQAVDGSTRLALQYGDRPIQAFYASSHGGHSESNRWVWGGSAVPYYQPVDDSRWEAASDNPHKSWGVAKTGPELADGMRRIGRAVGDRVVAVAVVDPVGKGGRIGQPSVGAGGVEVRGETGTTQVISGEQARTAFGVRSALFTVRSKATTPPPPCAPPTGAELNPAVSRLAGTDRVATALKVSGRWAAGTAPTVLLASARNYPDALAGGALAARERAPMLLTPPGELPQTVRDELDRLGTQTVLVLGGTAAVSDAVVAQAAADGRRVERIEGPDRFATAGRVAARAGLNARAEVVIALGRHADEGRAWPDALAAGALLATGDAPPMLLTDGAALPSATQDALDELRPVRALVMGGTASISEEVRTELRRRGIAVWPIAGANRYETSVAAAEEALTRISPSPRRLVFATGRNFPDALAAGPLAAATTGPVLLVPGCDLAEQAPAVGEFVRDRTSADRGFLVGGTGVVSERVRWELGEALRR
jgi:SpoIID/LytB domain protein